MIESARSWMRPPAVFLGLLLAATTPHGDSSETGSSTTIEGTIRSVLETGMREQQGREFTTFGCALPDLAGPPRAFTCSAVDDAGDEYVYLVEPDEEGALFVEMVSQPAGQLEPDFLAQLETPCREFLGEYATRSWEEIWTALHPALQEAISLESLAGQLDSMWQVLGPIESLHADTFSLRSNGRFELQYSGSARGGAAAFRCGVHIEADQASVIAFLLLPAVDSQLYSRLISEETTAALSRVLGLTVVRVDLPFNTMLNQYDVEEGLGWTASGREFAIRAERSGRTDDFEMIDFEFQVLDVPLIVAPHLRSRQMEPDRFDCPTRVAPDGGTLHCVVYLTDGSRLALAVTRRGGEHRIVQLQAIEAN